MNSTMGIRGLGRVVLTGCLVLACAARAIGQEQQLNLADIRKNNFGAIDKQRVQDWCQQRIKLIMASKEPLKDAPVFVTEITGHIQAADATNAFKAGMVETVATAFAALYKPATDSKDRAALGNVVLLAFLRRHDSPAATACYKLAINDAFSGVRLVAAEGLLKSKLSPQDWEELLPVLQKQASIETDPTTMDRLYRVLTMNGGPAVDRVVPVLLAILDARLTRFEQKGEFPAVADANVTIWLAGKFAQINNNQMKNDIIRGTARLLADAVYHYTKTQAGREQREQLERVVVITEAQLKTMAKPSAGQTQPDVTVAMTEGGAERNAKMEKAMDAWIGTAEVAGILNGAPYNFQRGLGIQRPAPTSRPASAPAATAPVR